MKCEKEGCHNKAKREITVLVAKGSIGYARTMKVCYQYAEDFANRKQSFSDKLLLALKRMFP